MDGIEQRKRPPEGTERDLDTALRALELIDRRGFGRGRRLLEDLKQALAELKTEAGAFRAGKPIQR